VAGILVYYLPNLSFFAGSFIINILYYLIQNENSKYQNANPGSKLSIVLTASQIRVELNVSASIN